MHEGDEALNFDPMIPIWAQVADTIQKQIVSGSIHPGDKLPGGRDLAITYSINPNTAARIYQELERKGICITRRGMGTYVTEDGEKIAQLRREMAENAVRRFLEEMSGLGLDWHDAVKMIEEEEDNLAEK